MFGRHTILLLMLLLAAVVPYASSSDVWGKISSLWTSGPKQRPATFAGSNTPLSSGASAGQRPAGDGLPQPADPQFLDLGEILNFDVTPVWVMARWPRVSAGLAELDLQGYRVSLVTGTTEHDLAGSLTYYFDKKQQAERIGFHGTTGDPRPLVTLVTGRYRLRRRTTKDPSLWLYQSTWNGKLRSELRIRPARVVRANVPRSRFEIEMMLERPN
jgi:hypothetical protein